MYLNDKDQRQLVEELLQVQETDGGWSLAKLGRDAREGGEWKSHGGHPDGLHSDGYATGLVVLALKGAGLASNNAMVKKGIGWLVTHEREGTWPASYPNKMRDPQENIGKFMRDAATAFAILALTEPNEAGCRAGFFGTCVFVRSDERVCRSRLPTLAQADQAGSASKLIATKVKHSASSAVPWNLASTFLTQRPTTAIAKPSSVGPFKAFRAIDTSLPPSFHRTALTDRSFPQRMSSNRVTAACGAFRSKPSICISSTASCRSRIDQSWIVSIPRSSSYATWF